VAPPLPITRRRRKALAVSLPLAVLASLALAPSAFAGIFLPESGGSPNADNIRTLYILLALLGLVIFVGVEGLIIYSMVKFKARKGATAAQIHGNTRLEIGWTVGAAVILLFITVFTFVKLGDITHPAASQIDASGNPIASTSSPDSNLYAATDQAAPPQGSPSMTIQVNGQQYIWKYDYPGPKRVFSYVDMVVPVGMTVVLNITAVDVAHSWWIPPLGGKADAIPGYINHTWFQIPANAIKPGEKQVVYHGQCAELCGRNHANMLAQVRVVSPEAYQAWYRNQATRIKTAQKLQAQERPKYDQPNVPDSAGGNESSGGASGVDTSGG
jgi:cytochrome c oxidase subunit 2